MHRASAHAWRCVAGHGMHQAVPASATLLPACSPQARPERVSNPRYSESETSIGACSQEHYACTEPQCMLSFVAFSSPQGLASHLHREHNIVPGRARHGELVPHFGCKIPFSISSWCTPATRTLQYV